MAGYLGVTAATLPFLLGRAYSASGRYSTSESLHSTEVSEGMEYTHADPQYSCTRGIADSRERYAALR